MKEYIVNNFKATLSQHALPQFLPTWGGKGGVGRDPMFEKYPSISPYTYCANNPMKYVDPTGMEAGNPSTHTDENGNVIAVFDDGDLGVYVHEGNKEQALAEVNKNYSATNKSAGGLEVGKSLHSLSFANQSLYNKTGQVRAAKIKIDFGSEELSNKVNEILNANPSIMEYANKAGGGGDWDIKSQVTNGSLLYGFYASPRDAGNFAAGVFAEKSGIEAIVQFGYGAYNLTKNNIISTGILTGTIALTTLSFPPVGIAAGQYISKKGEGKLSQLSIDLGKNFIKSGKKTAR